MKSFILYNPLYSFTSTNFKPDSGYTYYVKTFKFNESTKYVQVLRYLQKYGPTSKRMLINDLWPDYARYSERCHKHNVLSESRHYTSGSSKPFCGFSSHQFSMWNYNHIIVYNTTTRLWEIGANGFRIIDELNK